MEFVKVKRDDLIKQLKEYIDLLKKCSQNMEFHTCIEFCGIDSKFLAITNTYYAKKAKEAAKAQEQASKRGNI